MKFLYKNINQKESSITPEKYFYNKRKFLKIFGVVGLSTILSSKISFSFASQILNVKKNINFINKRPLTDEKYATTYNNYYEFGSSKNIWRSAQKLSTDPWKITIDGLVEKKIEKDATYTVVRKTSTSEEKAMEIAQLIGGREITEKTFSVAYEMLEQARSATG